MRSYDLLRVCEREFLDSWSHARERAEAPMRIGSRGGRGPRCLERRRYPRAARRLCHAPDDAYSARPDHVLTGRTRSVVPEDSITRRSDEGGQVQWFMAGPAEVGTAGV